jgi:AcrR family transcriptional regulator
MNTAAAARGRYHHGDLANALTQEATAMAREGGPEAVVLREAARRVGVSPTAAYRHFAAHEDLLHAVKLKAQQALADAMEEALAQITPSGSVAEDAIRRSYVLGEAYVRWALSEPGLFRSAFMHSDGEHAEEDATCAPVTEPGSAQDDPAQDGLVQEGLVQEGLAQDGSAHDGSAQLDPAAQLFPPAGANPAEIEGFRSFQILSKILDGLVETGLLSPERRPNAEFAPWATVHGLATLFLDGPLDFLPAEQRDQVLRATLDTIVKGMIDGTT